MAKLLSSFTGASIEVREGQSSFTGKIIGIEKREETTGDNKTEAYWLAIINGNGEARSFRLSQLSSIRLLDAQLREDLARYLSVVGTAHRKDNKTVVINADGQGSRQMLVSYTIAAPVWKTSYRMVIDNNGQSLLQGWAIVDNVQNEDWENVDLSLISGRPVSFVENLKQPIYRHRLVVDVPGGYDINPQTYEADGMTAGVGNKTGLVIVDGQPPANGIKTKLLKIQPGVTVDANGFVHSLGDQTLAYTEINRLGVTADTTSESIGELFQYHIDHPVTITRNHSALIPLVQAKIEGEAISVYNEQANPGLVLNGIRLKNTTGLTLESGPITVIDGDTYAGDALIDRLRQNENRLITYAVDLGLHVSTKYRSDRQSVTRIEVVNNALLMTIKNIETKTYTATNNSDKDKVLIIEHPRRADYKLLSNTEPITTMDQNYRFRVILKPHVSSDLEVLEEQPLVETFQIGDFTRDRVRLLMIQNRFSVELNKKLSQIIDEMSKLGDVEAEMSTRQKSIDIIVSDQQRLRDNIKALGQSVEERKLVTRYVSKLEETETTIEKLRGEIIGLVESKAKVQSQINALLRSLAID